jgi:hypothetical protein
MKELTDLSNQYVDPYDDPHKDTRPVKDDTADMLSEGYPVQRTRPSDTRGDHSTFAAQALCAQQLKEILRRRGGFAALSPVEREAIEVILNKVAEMVESPEEKHGTRWLKIAAVATHGRFVA